MSKKSSKLLMRKEEMILLKNSEAGKNTDMYGNIYQVLSNYATLSEEEFHTNKLLDDKSRAVILNNKKILIDEIKDEWVGIGTSDEASGEVHCQLCGRKNKYVYYIQNKLNEKELNVGSDCINKFPGIDNVRALRRSHTIQSTEMKRSKRRIEFDGIDLKNVNFIKEAEVWFKEFPILLSSELYDSFETVLYNLNFIRTNYIREGGDIETVRKQYFEFKNEFKSLQKKAKRFYERNKDKKLICDREMSEWLKIENPDVWGMVKKNKGLFNVETLKYAYNSKYVADHLKDFKSHLSDHDIELVNVNGSYIRFTIYNQDYVYPLIFTVPCRIFMQTIGCYCLTESDYTFSREKLSGINIERTTRNFDAMTNRLSTPLERIGLGIERSQVTDDKYYVRLPNVTKASKWSNRTRREEIAYKKISEEVIFNKFIPFIFADDDEIETAFMKIKKSLMRSDNWKSQKEKDRDESIAKSLTIQKQKEFINYS